MTGDFSPGAGLTVTLLDAHPSDPNVVFQSIVGFRGRGNQGVLRRSDNQGQTWKEALYSAVRVPGDIVGGTGVMPSRMDAALSSEELPSAVFKSDDGGVTWTEAAKLGVKGRIVEIGALAYDPSAPDHVWAALSRDGIQASEDGGTTWAAIGPPNWQPNDLALGVDGANLYAATKNGVFRLTLR